MSLVNLRLLTTSRKTTFGVIASSSRSFSRGPNACLNDADPFGFDRSQSTQPLKFRKPDTATQQLNAQDIQPSNQKQAAERSPSLLGGDIFRRVAENRQSQLQDLRRSDDRMKINREEKASLDQLWKSASQLKIQSHFGPLTPASSRVIRTVRIPPTSFLNRPVLASDVERSYKKLSSWLNAAGLRKEIYLNKRYEKPFLKRRRLRSERHRRRFAIEVQRRVQIINVMRMKGM
ncbi:hypothetical protein PTTG_02131 [Puccinia triticina 1-1 BBBD Race 1]|uniref:Ribosomal protein S21 n=2 Tax=Puccinia triticina TaxID=208348 RepID=A0A0C4EMZ1_PUCT1|nr:uncharacterized protein PtA15_5A246 [Puccinia triticina]OAV96108.1 hypothetical protein PTTG_02131 [Puccinia triticina 1-1 BBBD Race 1]WAQ84673.1 hypothetical protein PtA15_5A246 [Puccinia triticina]WAR58018.1 hypothetical protein PtB15_5B249 [Puccinia triticina]